MLFRKSLYFHIVILGLMFLNAPFRAYAQNGVEITVPDPVIHEAESGSDSGTLSETQFETVYQPLKEGIDQGDSLSVIKLYLLLAGGEVAEQEVQKVLEDGYLTDYIPDFVRAGVLSAEYRLPDSVTKKPSAVPVMEGASRAAVSHDFGELSEAACQALISFTADDIPENASLNLPAANPQKVIQGKTLSFSYYNSEPMDINFLAPDGYAEESWHFANLLIPEDQSVNLFVDHDEEQIRFHLGEVAFLKPVTVKIRMEYADAKYNAYGEDGTFRETYQTDHNGYLTMSVSSDADSVRLAREMVGEDHQTASSSNMERDSEEPVKEPGTMGLQIAVLIVFFAAIGLLIAAWVAEGKKKP